MSKTFWITDDRYKLIWITLVVMWLLFMVFFFLKAEEITNNPCEVCAKKLNKDVYCSINGAGKIISRTFYPNLTTIDIRS